MIIGITGFMGAGKHTVASMLQQKISAEVIDGDSLVHDLYKPHTALYKLIIDHFGDDIVDDSAHINRSILAQKVFADSQKLALLESLVHPVLEQEIQMKIDASNKPYTVVIAAILDKFTLVCDTVIRVEAEESEMVQRVSARDGLSESEIKQRLVSQNTFPVDWIIDNSGSLQDLDNGVEIFVHALRSKSEF